MMDNPLSGIIDWAWAGAALEGESGDCHVVAQRPHGVLFAAIDGLGHGAEAAEAARAAAALLHARAASRVEELVSSCHVALRPTRGAVMSLAALDIRFETIDWCGVGNVETVLFRAAPGPGRPREGLACPGGVVGYRLPATRVTSVPIRPQDVLIMATDGIREDFSDSPDLSGDAQLIADTILARHAKGTDDALVLVARYLGARNE